MMINNIKRNFKYLYFRDFIIWVFVSRCLVLTVWKTLELSFLFLLFQAVNTLDTGKVTETATATRRESRILSNTATRQPRFFGVTTPKKRMVKRWWGEFVGNACFVNRESFGVLGPFWGERGCFRFCGWMCIWWDQGEFGSEHLLMHQLASDLFCMRLVGCRLLVLALLFVVYISRLEAVVVCCRFTASPR